MAEEERNTREQNNSLPRRFWDAWSGLFDILPKWLFSPESDRTLLQCDTDESQDAEQLENYKRISERQEAIHDESSRTIRRIYYAVVGTCLFCILTLSGTPDSQIVVKGTNVTLPILNYPVGFNEFLVVGPMLLVGLWIYLHIFIGEIRLQSIPPDIKQPTLPNFKGSGARIVVLLTLYWMVPCTIVVFTWKAWPSSGGPYIYYTTIGVVASSIFLQMRRCPRNWRGWGLPLLIATFAAFYLLQFSILETRKLNLYRADLSKKDLENVRIANANMRSANLSDANLSRANLNGAKLSRADLTGADLIGANLIGAKLIGATLNGADLSKANLSGADLYLAKLVGAKLSNAKLIRAELKLSELKYARLYKVDLSGAKLNGANLSDAKLYGAILNDADLSRANLSGANLTKAVITQSQLDSACGNKNTKLPDLLTIKMC